MKKEVQVLVRCIRCKAERWIRPGEIKRGEYPGCEKDLNPMVAVKAEVREVPV